ncbi:MAG TPA: asparagine synthase (glutamine-hydrolyzing), partial [Minicystis sp.]|nr:asparagine synthase (glutamine-hydrolyzing) [Minicystis sp.]
MCGVAGIVRAAGLDAEAARASVERMLAFIRHRGPDEAGTYADARAVLGAVRLKILDLVGGQQPMLDASTRTVLAYNGETYSFRELGRELASRGHRLSTRSDTEVVLNALVEWGEGALARLDGPFALAWYDARDGSVLLARDRFGERPLYYAEHDGALVFASEMKAFLALPGFALSFDAAALATLFLLWTPLPDGTPFAGIRQVPPGCALRVRGDEREIVRFADVDVERPAFLGSSEDAAARARELLTESVRLRMRSDVEVGTYLSGGLDSAIVTSLARLHGSGRLHTFSVEFEEPAFDESHDQRALRGFFGTEHEAVRVGPGDVARAFPQAMWHAEVPAFRTAFVPMFLLARAARAAGVVVVLSGEGADETFLGYDVFKETLVRAAWSERRDVGALRRLYPYLPHFRDENAAALAAVFDRF